MRVQFMFLTLAVFLTSTRAAWAEPAATAAQLKRGKDVYLANCYTCHGKDGDGKGPTAQALDQQVLSLQGKFKHGNDVKSIYKVTKNGVRNTTMAAYEQLSDKDLWAVSHYTKSLPQEMALTKGKELYGEYCLSCHSGSSDNPKARSFKAEFKHGTSSDAIFKSITEGLEDTQNHAFKQLTDAERWAIVNYLKTFTAKGK